MRVPGLIFERHSGFCPQRVAEQLAEQIDHYARAEALGYYPALDFVRERQVVDAQLAAALDQLTWLGSSMVREELVARLRPLFASVQVQSMQALARLAEHLAANRVRFEVRLTLLRKRAQSEGLDSYIRRVTHRHLGQAFDSIAIANVKVLE